MVKMRRVESNVDVDPKKLEDLLSTMEFVYGSSRSGAPSFSYEETIKTDKFLKFFEGQILKEAQNAINYTIQHANKSKKPFQSLLDLYDKVENDDWRGCILDEWFEFKSPAYHSRVHWRVYLSLGMKDVSLTFHRDRPYTVFTNGDDLLYGRPYYAGMSDSEIEGIQKFFNTQIEQDRKNLYSRIENMLERIKPKVRAMRDSYIKDLQDLLKEDKNKSMEDFDGYTVFAELYDDDNIIAEYGPYPFESKRFIEDLKSATDDIYDYKNDHYEDGDSIYVENDAYLRIVVTTPDDKEVEFISPMEVEGEFGIDRYTNIYLALSIKSEPLECYEDEDDEEVEKVKKGLEKIDIPSFLTADYTEK